MIRLEPTSVAILLGVTLIIVGCDKDVTNDPNYGFSGVVGTWKAKAPLMLEKYGDDLFVTDRDLGTAVATLPPGTKVRIEHLIRHTTEAGYYTRIAGTIASGEHAGQSVLFDPSLFAPNSSTHPDASAKHLPDGWTFKWKVAPDKLEK